MVLIDKTNGNLDEVRKIAEELGPEAVKSLEEGLERLSTGQFFGKEKRTILYPDFAPLSFTFVYEYKDGEEWKYGMNGGLIYSGPGQALNGSAPAFTVSLSPRENTHEWSIHT